MVRTSLETFVKHDMLQKAEIEPTLSDWTFTTDLEAAVQDADPVVECIVENLKIKGELFQQLDRICRDDALIASSTSALNIYAVTPERRQTHTVIAHWFAPPQILPLVEVVRGPRSSDETLNTTVALLREGGEDPYRDGEIRAGLCDQPPPEDPGRGGLLPARQRVHHRRAIGPCREG